MANEIAAELLRAFLAPADEGGVCELHIVYTHFTSMVSQEPRVIRMLPLEIVEGVDRIPTRSMSPLYDVRAER